MLDMFTNIDPFSNENKTPKPDLFVVPGANITVTNYSDINDISPDTDAESEHTILIVGDIEQLPEIETWKNISGSIGKIFLHGQKGFQLFMPPYIEIEAAREKTTYCPELMYLLPTVNQHIIGELIKNDKFRIWIQEELAVSL